jgi:hypothetical protein
MNFVKGYREFVEGSPQDVVCRREEAMSVEARFYSEYERVRKQHELKLLGN